FTCLPQHYHCSRRRSHTNPQLHSFPTRRSSDLSAARLRRTEDRGLRGNGRERHEQEHRSPHRHHLRPRTRGLHHESGDGGGDDEDRKSTRLNSSHVAISYGVFSSKKKGTHGCTA